MLYRGSKDGFTYAAYKEHAMEKPNTIHIIKSNLDKIFGGYASNAFLSSSNGAYINDPHSFVFSLTHKTKHHRVNNNNSIY